METQRHNTKLYALAALAGALVALANVTLNFEPFVSPISGECMIKKTERPKSSGQTDLASGKCDDPKAIRVRHAGPGLPIQDPNGGCIMATRPSSKSGVGQVLDRCKPTRLRDGGRRREMIEVGDDFIENPADYEWPKSQMWTEMKMENGDTMWQNGYGLCLSYTAGGTYKQRTCDDSDPNQVWSIEPAPATGDTSSTTTPPTVVVPPVIPPVNPPVTDDWTTCGLWNSCSSGYELSSAAINDRCTVNAGASQCSNYMCCESVAPVEWSTCGEWNDCDEYYYLNPDQTDAKCTLTYGEANSCNNGLCCVTDYEPMTCADFNCEGHENINLSTECLDVSSSLKSGLPGCSFDLCCQPPAECYTQQDCYDKDPKCEEYGCDCIDGLCEYSSVNFGSQKRAVSGWF